MRKTLSTSMIPLWRQRNFRLLWGGQTISQLGSQVTVWALPLTAVLSVGATSTQTGLLVAASGAPYLLAGLFAGAWVDRVRRRPLMIAADVGRALLIGSIPLAAWYGRLSLLQLYLVAFGSGLCAILFDVAYGAFLPTVVTREKLLEGHSKLEASNAVAGIAGPGVAGVLVQWLSGPIALLIDACSFVAWFGSLALLRVPERPTTPADAQRFAWLSQVRQGIRFVVSNALLRPLAFGGAFFVFFDTMLVAIYVPYLIHELHISAGLLGGIFAIAGCGGLLGAGLAERIAHRTGMGRAIVLGIGVAAVAELVIALAHGPVWLAAGLVTLGEAGVQGGDVVASVANRSARQMIVPDGLQGRVTATVRVLAAAFGILGALIGGWGADYVGLRPTVLIAGLGTVLVGAWLWTSPVRHQHDVEQNHQSAGS